MADLPVPFGPVSSTRRAVGGMPVIVKSVKRLNLVKCASLTCMMTMCWGGREVGRVCVLYVSVSQSARVRWNFWHTAHCAPYERSRPVDSRRPIESDGRKPHS
jgi:hypothetical protein